MILKNTEMRYPTVTEQAIIDVEKEFHVLDKLVTSMFPRHKVGKGTGLHLCPDGDHMDERIKKYQSLNGTDWRHPLTEHGGIVALAYRNDEKLWRYTLGEMLYAMNGKSIEMFILEHHIACAMVHDTWGLNPHQGLVLHAKGTTQIRSEMARMTDIKTRVELYTEYTHIPHPKKKEIEKLESLNLSEVQFFPTVYTFRKCDEGIKDLPRTYKLSISNLDNNSLAIEAKVNKILAGVKLVA